MAKLKNAARSAGPSAGGGATSSSYASSSTATTTARSSAATTAVSTPHAKSLALPGLAAAANAKLSTSTTPTITVPDWFRKAKFPTYDPTTLTWNELRTLNEEGHYCYCGQDRYLDVFMLQCRQCKNWFHEGCVSVKLGVTIPFYTNYEFTCSACSQTGREAFQRSACAWKDVTTTALANLMMLEIRKAHVDMSARALVREAIEPYYFVRDEVLEFLDANWIALWGHNKAKVDHVWKGTLSTTLYQYREVFVTNSDTRFTNSPFTLFDQNLFNVRPGFLDLFSKTGYNGRMSSRLVSATIANSPSAGTSTLAPPGTSSTSASSLGRELIAAAAATNLLPARPMQPPGADSLGGDGTVTGPSSSTVFLGTISYSLLKNRYAAQRRERGANLPSAVIVHGSDTPFNRDGYQYRLAEWNPHFKYTVYRENNVLPWRGPGVHMSREDRSPAVTVSRDGRTCTAAAGFRTARATCGVQSGAWYFEVFVDKAAGRGATAPNEAPHVRIGVAKREATLMGPVGYDDLAFAYRDVTGEKVSNSRLTPYGEAYGPGDVIGVLIVLPPWRAVKRGAAGPGAETALPTTPTTTAGPTFVVPPLANGTSSSSMPPAAPSATTLPLPRTRLANPRARTAIRYKTSVYFESKDYLPPKNHPPPAVPLDLFPKYPTVPGSKIVFYKNGVCQGTAFEDLPAPIPEVCSQIDAAVATMDDGTLGYYPAVSCFKGGQVTMNFGPHFMYPLPDDCDPIRVVPQVLTKVPVAEQRPTDPPRSSVTRAAAVLAPAAPAPAPGPVPVPPTNGHGDDVAMAEATHPFSPAPPPAPTAASLNGITAPSTEKPWRPFTAAAVDHDIESCLWDLVDDVEYWHALENHGDPASLKVPPIAMDRDHVPKSNRALAGQLVFPTKGETYEEHLAREERAKLGAPSIKDLLMPKESPARRVRVKWALTEGEVD
ncbi:hypothetical protein GGF31_005663 [Allomyces arbusculus]|nr:hypothetical protein GGF31_005663 [Allomyces arbusculus]